MSTFNLDELPDMSPETCYRARIVKYVYGEYSVEIEVANESSAFNFRYDKLEKFNTWYYSNSISHIKQILLNFIREKEIKLQQKYDERMPLYKKIEQGIKDISDTIL